MTLTIDLSDEQALVLKAKAEARGVSTAQYARQVLEHDLVPYWLRESWDNAVRTGVNQLSTDEIEAEIATARKARHEGRQHPVHDPGGSRHQRHRIGVVTVLGSAGPRISPGNGRPGSTVRQRGCLCRVRRSDPASPIRAHGNRYRLNSGHHPRERLLGEARGNDSGLFRPG